MWPARDDWKSTFYLTIQALKEIFKARTALQKHTTFLPKGKVRIRISGLFTSNSRIHDAARRLARVKKWT